jgi:hypothetical protein
MIRALFVLAGVLLGSRPTRYRVVVLTSSPTSLRDDDYRDYRVLTLHSSAVVRLACAEKSGCVKGRREAEVSTTPR